MHNMHKFSVQLFLLLLGVLLIPLVAAEIAIESFASEPQQIQPGQEVLFHFEVENGGKERVQGILVSLDLTQLPFVPLDSSTEKVIERIREGDSRSVTFRLRALPTASPALYKIPVTLSYNGVKQISLVSQEVIAAPQLNVLLESSTLVQEGDQGDVIFNFVNQGLIPVGYLTVTLRPSPQYEIISAPSVYVGEVAAADFETEKFTVVAKAIDPLFVLDMQYRDQNNQPYSRAALVSVKVYSPEEAKALGLTSGVRPWWIALVVLLLVLIAFFLMRRRRKKQVH